MSARSADSRNQSLLSQIIRYIGMAALSSAITIGLPVLLHEGFDMAEEIAVALAYGMSTITNFFIARNMIFGSSSGAQRDASRYIAMTAIYRSMEYGLFILLHSVGGLHYVLTILLVQGVFTIIKFVTLKYWLFRPDPA
jgi:putative flippase GtrA